MLRNRTFSSLLRHNRRPLGKAHAEKPKIVYDKKKRRGNTMAKKLKSPSASQEKKIGKQLGASRKTADYESKMYKKYGKDWPTMTNKREKAAMERKKKAAGQ